MHTNCTECTQSVEILLFISFTSFSMYKKLRPLEISTIVGFSRGFGFFAFAVFCRLFPTFATFLQLIAHKLHTKLHTGDTQKLHTKLYKAVHGISNAVLTCF